MVVIVAEPFRDSFVRKYREVFGSFRTRNMSAQAVKELQEYFEFCWADRRDEAAAHEIMSALPHRLWGDLAVALSHGILRGDSPIVREAALSFRRLVFTPGDMIWRAGDAVHGVLFVASGIVVVRRGALERRTTGREAFGEDALIGDGRAKETLLASSFVTAMDLPPSIFFRLRAECPEVLAEACGWGRECAFPSADGSIATYVA